MMRNYKDGRNIKETKDAYIAQIEGADAKFGFNSKEDNSAALNKATQDPSKPNYSESGTYDNPADCNRFTPSSEIEHFPSGRQHSFMHQIDEDSIRKNKGMRLNQRTHDPANGE